jgi:hypothetical protein
MRFSLNNRDMPKAPPPKQVKGIIATVGSATIGSTFQAATPVIQRAPSTTVSAVSEKRVEPTFVAKTPQIDLSPAPSFAPPPAPSFAPPPAPSSFAPPAPAPAPAPATTSIPVLQITELESAPLPGASVVATQLRTKKVSVPQDAPILSNEEYRVGEQSLQKRIEKRIAVNPSERPRTKKDLSGNISAPIFTPISSPSFRDFIIQAYASYSPAMKSIMEKKDKNALSVFVQDIKEGKIDATLPKKAVDPDACKTRSNAELDMFYYQKFVRDYLQRGSPYRGLLVYHGLGTGKTCTSIAAAEALYWGNLKKIYVLTPATLSNNYRKDLGKCGYFPLRTKNNWSFFPVNDAAGPQQYVWLEQKLGLSTDTIIKQKGAWIPDPDKPNNWSSLSEESRNAIRQQQREHMDHRFTFIHYNGFSKDILAQFAEQGIYPSFMLKLEAEFSQYKRGDTSKLTMIEKTGKLNGIIQGEIRKYTKSPDVLKRLIQDVLSDEFMNTIKQEVVSRMFDDSVVIIDEVHNLVRTITGVKVGQLNLARIIDEMEPHQYNWNTPIRKTNPGFLYPRGYSLYRMLQNAVGCKIVGLSATPMINYAHEMAILMNIIAGEQRSIHIPLRGEVDGKRDSLLTFLNIHPSIDYYDIKKDTNVLTIAPVPSGFIKVVEKDAEGNPVARGFVRPPPWPESKQTPRAKDSNERNLVTWGKSIMDELVSNGFLKAPVEITDHTYPLLPEDQGEFVSNFIQKETLRIMNPNILKARTLGYVSYYKGQSEELMPRGIERSVVRVPMSEHMFVEYVRVRNDEIDRDKKKKSAKGPESVGGPSNLYAQATKVLQTGFMSKSRAACNFTFPEGITRPVFASLKQEVEILGLQPANMIAVDRNTEVAKKPSDGTKVDAGEEMEIDQEELEVDEGESGEEKVAKTKGPSKVAITGVIKSVMDSLESEGGRYLNEELATFSPKYFVMIENISSSPGPVLVYSQFKTLEGLGIFSSALRTSKGYIQLDIVKGPGGEWEIPAESMDPTKPKFIIYSGDQDLEKRRLLLQLYNADVATLPARLSKQCTELLNGSLDNRDGRICKVFMITQSGAEGISLMNTRQVHLMEPYWNNVRRQQVIGRAIRLCSHMNLPWDDRVVEIFTYLSVMTLEQKKDNRASMIMANDSGLTTDEMIYDIAVKKQMLADGLQEILQSAAVDCELHFHEHVTNSKPGEVTQCFRIGSENAPAFMTSPDWHDDLVSLQVRKAGGK